MADAAGEVVKPVPRPGWPSRVASRLLRGAVVVYLLICVIVYFAQNWLAFPGTSYQGSPQTVVNFGGSAEVLRLGTANGIPITAVFGAALDENGSPIPDASHCPTIIYFYGNASSIAWSEGEFDHMRRLGANVLIPDLAGFGASGGSASEANFYATADAGWDYLMRRPGIDPARVVPIGWSMGAAVAVDLAHRKPVAGLATFNAFTDLPSMAHHLFPYLPTSLLLKYRFDNLAKIHEIHRPTFICNGVLDNLVPPEMSDRLATAAGGPVTRLRIRTADHNAIFEAEPDTVWPALRKFIDGIATPNESPDVHPGLR